MEKELRIQQQDFMLNEERLSKLRTSPTYDLTRHNGRRIHLLIQEEESVVLAFSLREDIEGREHLRSSIAKSEDDAVKSLGDGSMYNYYSMRVTGEVPTPLRLYKADSF